MPQLGRSYSLEDVSDGDGTATTLLFAEKAGSEFQSNWTYPGVNASQAFSFQTNSKNTSLTQFPAFGLAPPLPLTPSVPAMPSSLHSGGGVVAFCDGHTYFLGSDVSTSVYTQLVTSSNANATGVFNLSSPLDESQY